MIRVMLVDDHASLRGAFSLVMEHQPDMVVVAEAGSVSEARAYLQSEDANIDVAILDFDLPDGTGDELIGDLQAINPRVEVLVLSGVAEDAQFARAVEAGASGVLHKAAPTSEVLGSVRRLAAGEQLLSAQEIIRMLRLAGRQREEERDSRLLLDSLTVREREVLQLLAEGLGNKEIAERLGVSERTSRNQMSSIITKLGVNSRLQALIFAVRHGAVRLP